MSHPARVLDRADVRRLIRSVDARRHATRDRVIILLGSGLVDHSQKMMVAAGATAEKKAVGHRS